MNNDVFEFLCKTERSFYLTCKVLHYKKFSYNVYGTEDDTVRKEKRIEKLEMRAEGRHFWFCNMCGRPDYPACRSWCQNGKIEDKKIEPNGSFLFNHKNSFFFLQNYRVFNEKNKGFESPDLMVRILVLFFFFAKITEYLMKREVGRHTHENKWTFTLSLFSRENFRSFNGQSYGRFVERRCMK